MAKTVDGVSDDPRNVRPSVLTRTEASGMRGINPFTIGKSGDVVVPETKTLPWESTATALAASFEFPARILVAVRTCAGAEAARIRRIKARKRPIPSPGIIDRNG